MSRHKIHLEVKIHFRVLMGHLDRDLQALKDLKVSHPNSIVDKDLEERREEFMRTLIKNPSKVLIILERSKGEKSIPEMDKVLDTFKLGARKSSF